MSLHNAKNGQGLIHDQVSAAHVQAPAKAPVTTPAPASAAIQSGQSGQSNGASHPNVPSAIQTPAQNIWQRLFGRMPGEAQVSRSGAGKDRRNKSNNASRNSAGSSNGNKTEMPSLVLYAELKKELEKIDRLPIYPVNLPPHLTAALRGLSSANQMEPFAKRVDDLIAIDRRVEHIVAALAEPHVAIDWQSRIKLRVTFGRRLAQVSTRLALRYRDLLDEGRRKYGQDVGTKAGSRGASQLPAITCRAIMHIGISMRWHCYANMREPASSWGRLYRLYRYAERSEILREPVMLGALGGHGGDLRPNAKSNEKNNATANANTTCHQEFAKIILFGLAEPLDFAPAIIDTAFQWCGEWSNLLEFSRANEIETAQHCFDMEGSLPPSLFHPNMQSDRVRCFSTASVCFKVMAVRDSLQQENGDKLNAVAGHASKLTPAQRDDLIRHLRYSWVKARPARRIERATDGLKVARVACGVSAINELLNAEAKPERGIPAEFSFEHWSVENESVSGYGLKKKKISEEPEPGKLVCLRANGSPIWQVGVVRWERNGTTGEPQLGIETLADGPRVVLLDAAPAGVSLASLSTAAGGGVVGDVVSGSGGGAAMTGAANHDITQPMQIIGTPNIAVIKGLLLPRDQSRGTPHSLVMSGRTFNVGTVLKLTPEATDHSDPARNIAFWVRLSGVIDYTDDWVRMRFVVLARA